jgi:HEAT repeat protein
MLDDSHEFIRQVAVESLGKCGGAQVIGSLAKKLDDRSAAIRAAAAKSLGECGGSQAVEPLLRMLDDSDEYVREKASESLGKYGGSRAIEPLLKKLDDKFTQVRAAAAKSLGKCGASLAVEPLLRKLADPTTEFYERTAIFDGLAELHDVRAIEPLSSLMEVEDNHLSVMAAFTIMRLGDDSGLHALDRFLLHPSRSKRRLAVEYLARGRDSRERLVLGEHIGWIDPQEPISVALVTALAEKHTSLSEEEIRQQFRELKNEFHLTLEF